MIDGVPCSRSSRRRLADAGILVVRYDRRGGGQSGGRTETATLADYADDVSVGGALAVEARRRRQAADRGGGPRRRRRGRAASRRRATSRSTAS